MRNKMAASHGSQSPPSIGRPVDRVFEDAQFTGEIILYGRKLRDFPIICTKFDLNDTIHVDISRNRLSELPVEICDYLYAERINCYHNVIRSIPDAISQLQALTHLNLSRNQLTVLSPALCGLKSLEVLSASNNKLVSLPEEIGQLENLMDLDVSCNEISHLPFQIGDLSSLRTLNLRRNFLVELPLEISRLHLYRLDFSSNRIEKIPTVFRKMETLQQLIHDNNPLSSPPAYICTKGKQHIMKYLQIEAIKEDRKRGIMVNNDSDIKRYVRKSLPPQQPSEDFRNMLGAPESKWKRHTVLSNDSGYSTGDGEKNGWASGEMSRTHSSSSLGPAVDTGMGDPRVFSPSASLSYHSNNSSNLKQGQWSRSSGRNMAEPPVSGSHSHQQCNSSLMDYSKPRSDSPSLSAQYYFDRNNVDPRDHSKSHVSRPVPVPTHSSAPSSQAGPQWQGESRAQLLKAPSTSSTSSEPAVSPPIPPHVPIHQPEERRAPLYQMEEDFEDRDNLPVVMTGDMEDEFTRELRRQKADYERRKKQAEEIRLKQQLEDEEREKEERRQAAIKLQEEQKWQEELRRQEEARKVEEMKKQKLEEQRQLEERKREEEEALRREEELKRLQESALIQEAKEREKERAAQEELRKATESKMAEEARKNKLSNNGVADGSRLSSASTTPSVSPSPSPSNSVSHLAKPTITSPGGAPSLLAKPGSTSGSPSGSHSHLAKPTGTSSIAKATAGGTKSGVPRANGPTSATSQAVRRTKMAGDRSNTASPVTARSTRTTGTTGIRSQSGSITPGSGSNLRRSSNSSTTDDETKSTKVPNSSVAPSRLKSRLEEQKQRGAGHPPTVRKLATPDNDNKRINIKPPTNSYGSNRTRPGGYNKGLEDSAPNHTLRRKEDQQREEAEQMDRLRQTVESRLKVTLPDNLAEALRDGVVLCHLANQIRPRSVGSIHVPSPAVPKLTLAKCRRNVDNFLEACRKIGVGAEQICGPQDIFEEKGISKVAITVAALVAIGTNPKQSAV